MRFRHNTGAEHALSAFRRDEIVVQDVAVVVKPLQSGDVLRRDSNNSSGGGIGESNFVSDGDTSDDPRSAASHSTASNTPQELDNYSFPTLVRVHRKSESSGTGRSGASSQMTASPRGADFGAFASSPSGSRSSGSAVGTSVVTLSPAPPSKKELPVQRRRTETKGGTSGEREQEQGQEQEGALEKRGGKQVVAEYNKAAKSD